MKRNLNEYMDAKRSALIDPSWEDVDCLLAALEEAQQQLTTAKEERDSQQRVCIKVMEELAEAQQTIARQREALEEQRNEFVTSNTELLGKLLQANQVIEQQQNKLEEADFILRFTGKRAGYGE
jgi:chromosome segregation ATPase